MTGTFCVLSGPSGAGKSTVIRELQQRLPNLEFSVSATTRPMREGEVEGTHYYFKTREAFDRMVENGELLEHAEYVGNCYGTPRAPIEACLARGVDVITDVDTVGALQIKKARPETPLIFVAPPSFDVLEERLRLRGDTAEDLIQKRLEKARWEYTQASAYDYIVINDDVSQAVEEILAIMQAEHCRTSRRIDLLKED